MTQTTEAPDARSAQQAPVPHFIPSANRAQAASDRRALADHDTLIALHEMAKQQLDILKGQDQVLDILHGFAAKDLPGRQRQVQDGVNQILAILAPEQG